MRAPSATALVTVIATVLAACGGKAVFRLSSDENNAFALTETLARRKLPATPTPVNEARTPRVFVLTAGKGATKTIVAYDLASGNVMWKADGDVRSRISVGGDFIVALEGDQLVARDQVRGAPRWRTRIPGTFVGAAADADRAYVVYQSGTTWWLAAYAGGNGEQVWRADASGQLGAPAAHGGVVYVPFLRQWLSIVDGRTGQQLTRIRGIDEQIAMLRVTSTVAYFGSKQGVFQLDARSASGSRNAATYGRVAIPAELDGTTFGREMYDPVQNTYTAAERKRVLWTTSSQPIVDGPMKLLGGGYAIHYFRFVFGFDDAGALRWAYSHPRVELVASDHTGHAIVGVSSTGDIVALDPQTGAVRSRRSIGPTSQVLGATFDADGWAPSGEGEPVTTASVLVAIARDPDARFDRVKELAITALGALPGPEVTSELLGVLGDGRAPQRLKDLAVDVLVRRRDAASLPVLTAQLAVTSDYIAQTEPETLAPVAKAIAGLANVELDGTQVGNALAALRRHLAGPWTSTAELVLVIEAMAAIGGGAERSALGSHLLLYRADDDLGDDASWQRAVLAALGRGGPGERELLRWIADEPRTRPSLAAAIRELLGS